MTDEVFLTLHQEATPMSKLTGLQVKGTKCPEEELQGTILLTQVP